MQGSKLSMLLFVQFSSVDALAITSLIRSYPSAAVPITDGQPWSKQDVLTLVGVCVAVVTVIIGLVGVLIASPKTRVWLCRPIYWLKRGLLDKEHSKAAKLKHRPSTIKDWKRRDHKEVHQQLQDHYTELLKTRRGRF